MHVESSSLSMTPIGSETVVNKIIEEITAAIIQKRFKSGDCLPSEHELMAELKVGRNSLREAMKILSAMGVVEIKRGNGTYISSQVNANMFDSVIYSLILGSSNHTEVIELRHVLDKAVLELAIEKCTSDDIDKLQEYINKMREKFKYGEITKAAKLDYEFHRYLNNCCRNIFLARMVNSVYVLFEQSIEKNIRTEDDFAKADDLHQDMVDCLRNKDLSNVTNVVNRSLASWQENVRKNQILNL